MDADYYAGLYDWDFDEPEEPFKTECKWCGKRITMTPTDDGWRPMFRDKLHICQARLDAQREEMISLLPDIDEA